MALELRVPAERIDPPRDVELRPREAKAWVESLTFQGAPTIRKILANLGTFNRVKLPFDDRLQLLEAYRPIVMMILNDLDSGLARSSPHVENESLALARELSTELACGYKILILEKYGKLLAFGAKKQLPFLVFRAMESLVQLLRLAFSSYTRVPEGTWREIHQLYLLAEKEGIALELADPEGKLRICDLYIEALLISLTDPHRLPPGEVEKVLQVIRTHRSPFAIGQDRPSTPPGGHFLIPCDQDQPPRPLRSVNDDPGGPHWRLLDANPVVDKIRAHRQALETGNISAATSKATKQGLPELLAKLETLWGDPPRRLSQREAMDTSVALCSGLRAITHFVTNEPRIDRRRERDAIERGITLPLLTLPKDDLSREMNVAEWVVVDQGDRGLKVHRDGPSSAPGIMVGELVGIKSMGKARWAIGAVRRVTLGDGGETELGVELLAQAATSVAIRPVFNSGSPARPGFLLAEEDDYAGAARLLAPPPTYSDLREFDVEDNDRFARVRATSLIERTDRFELFHIVPS